jgi:hypothetical protein
MSLLSDEGLVLSNLDIGKVVVQYWFSFVSGDNLLDFCSNKC